MDLKELGKKIDRMDDMLHGIDKNLAITKNNIQRINGSVKKNTDKVNKLENQLVGITVKITMFVSFVVFLFSIVGSWIWRKVLSF